VLRARPARGPERRARLPRPLRRMPRPRPRLRPRGPLHLNCEAPSPAEFEELDLVAVDHPAESELIVHRPGFPESVFRGCVERDGVPVADALQCWLDVSFHAARGEEQAKEIAARIWPERWSD